MASVRREADMIDFDRKKAGVGHFETDELDEIFPHRFRYSPGSPLVHKSTNKLKLVPQLRHTWNKL